MSFLLASLECLACLHLALESTVSFIPRRTGYVQAHAPVADIKSSIERLATNSTPLVIGDISLLLPFHTTIEIAALLKSLSLPIVVCTDAQLFLSLEVQFSQTIRETSTHFTMFSPKTKKAHTISKTTSEVKAVVAVVVDDSAERDVMSDKQRETKDNVELQYEKVMRFGDDSDVSSDEDE